ncbi:ABC transporter permease [Williamsia phyllosphaerae]|uniref:ABC transporter permease n=1 Tax=Williamsia phyllosphaerae TaxID=885042 RepID=A0ABQ1UDM6_9NOCA|nr:FtsX-like permease family protein [Williamsia phyllosphaerae]GGF14020.1 ABC transporter permease [Williamsia phyllosphaerae]
MAAPAMRRVSLRNLAAHKVRLVLTVLSVVLGTSFVAGSIIFTATISSAFDGIFDKVAVGVDTRLSPKDSQSTGIDEAVVAQLNSRKAELGISRIVPRYSAPVTIAKADGTALQTGGAPSVGTAFLPQDQALSPTESKLYPGGRAPVGAGEIVLNKSAADKADLTVGSTTKLVVARGNSTPQTVKVVGLVDLPGDTSGFVNVQLQESVAKQELSDGSRAAYVEMSAVPGVSAQQLTDRVASAVGDDYKTQTGAQVRQQEKDNVNQFLDVFNYILLAFAAIGLIVGTFIIYNTFSMIIAQRVRELALLRAIGASRRQITRSVLLEAFVVGLFGGVIGLGIGIGLAAILKAVTSSTSGLPTASLQITPGAIISCMAVGIVVTMVSAYAPARRAAQVSPVEAMRESATDGASSLRMRTSIGGLLAVVGIALVLVGTSGQGAKFAATVGGGALVLIFAVVFAAPALSRPFVGALGRVIGRPFGKIGQLARTNAVRNPRRTAATAFALTLGLMLVAVVGTFGSSLKGSIDDTINKELSADLVLATSDQGSLPTSVVNAANNTEGVASTVSFRIVAAKVGDETITGVSPKGDLSAVTPYEMLDGASKSIPSDGMIISEKTAKAKGWKRGQVIDFVSFDGTRADVRISGIFKDSQILDPFQMGDGAYGKLVPAGFQSDRLILIKAADGVSVNALRDKLTAATKDFLTVQVNDRAEFVGQASSQIDQMLAVLYGMLGLALVIAVLGIVNTLALSVIERKREIGMLRAIGMARSQIRRTIYVESVLIAIFGAVLGVILGSVVGIAVVRTFKDLGITTAVLPYELIGITLVGAAVVGVLAALWPAVRAARTNPLEAISDV